MRHFSSGISASLLRSVYIWWSLIGNTWTKLLCVIKSRNLRVYARGSRTKCGLFENFTIWKFLTFTMKTRQRKTIGKKRKSASAISFSILAVKVDANNWCLRARINCLRGHKQAVPKESCIYMVKNLLNKHLNFFLVEAATDRQLKMREKIII